ncbi:aminopeptidase P family protein [Massilia sp. IC2-477]|uniref:M24 family metallopeptidase n=1 Tax=Massilia sp. IC2-477 TaxID=2887198 RepID=UPI001D125A9D|nr:M24 family metallopeptidase [Massilia sp. IC2-477]MCC2957600.1 aminopeptidase P family protein [Massilia sp. IC2-477]
MSNTAERVGPAFSVDGMMRARAETRKAIKEIAARIRPGMIEEDAVDMAKEIIRAQGHALSWHPTRVRFGANTMKPMKQASAPGIVLGENDIFFIDIAPRVDDWEGDGGAAFVVGHASEYARCAADAERLFHEVRAMWRAHAWTGQQLYDFAAQRAGEMGWRLNPDLPGHRVSDFPHAAIHTGSLADYTAHPSSMRWILEIHLTDPQGRFGAFFEDMLLDDQHYVRDEA